MADGYWRYAADPRHQLAMAAPLAATSLKRPRSDFPDVPAGPEMLGYYPPRDEDRASHRSLRDSETINASYDHYLRNGISSFGPSDPARPVPRGMTGHPVDDPRMIGGGMDGRTASYNSGRADATNTLFVEGLPVNCTRREVSHIFRPFVGFREVRLVNKESRNAGGDPVVLCFVDFENAAQATKALDALQGYKVDEHERDSGSLRLQFARFPGPRSGGGPRGRR